MNKSKSKSAGVYKPKPDANLAAVCARCKPATHTDRRVKADRKAKKDAFNGW